MAELPPTPTTRTVAALVSDLIFSTKITSTGRSLAVDVRVFRTVDELEQAVVAGAAAAIIDLNAMGADPVEAIRRLRSLANPPRILAYLSHVQTELAETARQAGADLVLPRSAFAAQLPQLLKDWANVG
jgi:DNA-binding NarL/FixJ family response regulator